MSKDSAEGLLGCPFCGGEASGSGVVNYGRQHQAFWPDGKRILRAYFCNCIKCGITNRGLCGHRTPAEAIAKWNSRANPSSAAWISVSEKLPDDDMTVLIVMDDGEVWTGYMDGDSWRYVSGDIMQAAVTHWMHMPEPPAGAAKT